MTTVTLNEETIKDITRRLEKIDLICERQAIIHFNTACKCEVFDDLVNDGSAIGMAKVFALIKHVVIECLGDLEEEDT